MKGTIPLQQLKVPVRCQIAFGLDYASVQQTITAHAVIITSHTSIIAIASRRSHEETLQGI